MPLATLDPQLRYQRVDPGFAAFTGRSVACHLGRALENATPELAALVPLLRDTLESGEPALRKRVELGGRVAFVDCLPLRGDGSQVAGLAVLVLGPETLPSIARLAADTSARFIGLAAGDIDGAVARALADIRRHVESDRAWIAFASSDPQRWRIGHEDREAGMPSIVGVEVGTDSLRWSLGQLSRGQAVVLDRIDALPPEAAGERALHERFGTRAALVVPLIGRRVVGAMGFTHVHAERSWPQALVEEVLQFGAILASALDRKAFDQALDGRLRFERCLATLSTQLLAASSDDMEAVLSSALGEIAGPERFDQAMVFVRDGDRFRARLEWRENDVLPVANWLPECTEDQLPPATMAETVVLSPSDLPPLLRRPGGRALLIAPLLLERRTIGLLAFHCSTPRPLGEFLSKLSLVARMVASALARKLAEDACRDAFDQLAALKQTIEQERDYLRDEIRSFHELGAIVGESDAMRRAVDLANAVARSNATVLICGESGVGKELFARAIHAGSTRAGGPLVKVNCAAIPTELFESEFFGHVRGAFTGAHRDRLGRFEMANQGSIFLDEVGEIPLGLQAKLLRVLQEGELERVGDDHTRRVDVRVIAATNRDLRAEVAAGRFRGDLYYRLSVVPVIVPPLRERGDDVLHLADHFLQLRARNLGRPALQLDEAQRRRLLEYDWPGNVRELQHVIERAVILSADGQLRLDLALAVPQARPAAMTEAELRRLERSNIEAALAQAQHRIAGKGGAAELLGLKASTLRDRIKALGIDRARRPSSGRVLVLDDDPDLREALRGMLGAVCYCDALALGSVEELERNAREVLACSLAVLDLDLGTDQRSGVDAYHWLIENKFRGEVVFLTGRARRHPLVEQAHRLGAAFVLEKPIAVVDLMALLRRLPRKEADA